VATIDALEGDARIILGARLECDDRLGLPDLIERTYGGWVAGDVKSGSALDADGRAPVLNTRCRSRTTLNSSPTSDTGRPARAS
jgi:hypothetical protein